ncbi:hypothetical protein Lfu02_09800 [Longispora fulva]|uniref:Photosynthesis system II assembly factor Ycf48/Hcf136-like domain-containing protein n=1 Tax=Longispora fulva TaxID=619741 RepID=A0A8J7GEP8_9ACTN|nr:hypothetical protein [Longispora fulva]MBG6135157.1 hypothetical protein [Longispora fulva]GIG56608.1 hypothetical protein Lfu02_09800 [Longispora fulva]
MSELDFVGLRSDAEYAARPPEFATVTRRTRAVRRRRALVLGGVFVGVAALTGAIAAVTHRDPVPTVVGVDETPRAAEGLNLGMVPTVEGYGDHLYAFKDGRLWATEDRGATWLERTAPGVDVVRVLGPNLVIGGPGAHPLGEQPSAAGYQVSVDGGRTWMPLRESGRPVAAVPEGTRPVSCDDLRKGCRVRVVDPVTGILSTLAAQPRLDGLTIDPSSTGAGLWAAGFDPGTHKAAIATSADRGTTWSITVLAAEEPRTAPVPVNMPYLASFDGRTGYATFVGDGGPVRVYRTADGGRTWHRAAAAMPGGAYLLGPYSVATADGTHLMAVQLGTGTGYLASPDGETYQVREVAGLPGLGAAPRFLGPGRLAAGTPRAMYLSDDGVTWRGITLP